ncbi:MAG: N-acetylglucosamine-6-phosphate deacetylase [Verrucomicrobiota bacterium]
MKMNGFVDIQNNGWMGTDFSEEGLTVERVKEITSDLVERGTIGYCPTVITSSPEVCRHTLGTIAEAMKDPDVGAHILGIHIEGPFISPLPGARGAHPPECVLDPDIGTFDRFQEWAQGNIKIMTLAPERPGCEVLVKHAVKQGVAVSMGHHMANDDDMQMAVDAGATLCTHVGNGIPNEINRHNNPLWWQFASDDVSGLFITDGHHLPADLIKVALRSKTPDRFIVTSDASPLAGMPPGNYKIFGDLPVAIDESGLIYSEESKSLAGSHSTMLECMNHLASLELLGEAELMQVGLANPLAVLGMKPEDVSHLQGPELHFDNNAFKIGG